MTECQGCGAWNDTSRILCVLCGTPLAGTDEWDAAAELLPLPPLPDGGLHASMPSWLREPPPVTPSPPPRADTRPGTLLTAPEHEPRLLAARADPRTFLSDDDFPQWLRDLAARRDEAASHSSAMDNHRPAALAPAAAEAVARLDPAAWPNWPGAAGPALAATEPEMASVVAVVVAPNSPAPLPASELIATPVSAPSPAPDGRPPAAVVAARAFEERRNREPWETLLLVLLCIGVIVAALWALVSNGVFSPGL